MNEYFYQLLIGGEWRDAYGAAREDLVSAAHNARVSVGGPKRILLRHTNPSNGAVTVTVLWEGKRPPRHLGEVVAP